LRLAPAQVFAQRRSKTPLTVAGFLCVIVVTNPSHLPHYPPARVLRKLSHRLASRGAIMAVSGAFARRHFFCAIFAAVAQW
jgi:hypothetical protein